MINSKEKSVWGLNLWELGILEESRVWFIILSDRIPNTLILNVKIQKDQNHKTTIIKKSPFFSFLLLCVYVVLFMCMICVHVCMGMCMVCVHVYMAIYSDARRSICVGTKGRHLESSSIALHIRSLTEPRALWFSKAGWPIDCKHLSLVSTSSALGLQAQTSVPSFLYGC